MKISGETSAFVGKPMLCRRANALLSAYYLLLESTVISQMKLSE